MKITRNYSGFIHIKADYNITRDADFTIYCYLQFLYSPGLREH